jgi:hypothetical protein
MKKRAALALIAGATTTFCLRTWASMAPDAAPPLPGLRAAGQGTLRFWGFDIYSARLWVSPGFQADRYAALPLALTLAYQRDFSAQSIAERSLTEMQRVDDFSPAQGTRWRQALQAALPEIKAGDHLTGLFQPGGPAVFQLKGKTVGEVTDPAFGPLFFGIWLSPRTSEPRLREALLALPGAPQ